jgi:flavin reductase (DIM6/NTAB) family NADH-FMN oxidoreductase RutF
LNAKVFVTAFILYTNEMPKMLQNNKKINFAELSKEFLDQLQKGAFLTVKSGTQVNMMTIAWGSLGFMWNKLMFTAMVRYSRHTYDLLENALCSEIKKNSYGAGDYHVMYYGEIVNTYLRQEPEIIEG